MRFEPIANPTLARRLSLPALAIGATILVAAALALLAGADPFAVLGQIVTGAVGSRFALLETLNRATPLIFTGLAVAVAFRARLWNIGAEAQLYAGAIMTVLLGTGALHAPLVLPLSALAAIAAGALVLLGPVLLKVRLGVDEVVTTLLLNFVMLLLVSWLLEGPLRDPMGMGWPKSAPLIKEARLPRIVGVKDATGRLDRVCCQRITCGPDFIQLSGEDATAHGFNAQGGVGCISVTANVAPALCAQMQAACAAGDYAEALRLQDRLMPLHIAIFIEPGLVGAKYALSRLGRCTDAVRLPLVPLTAPTRARIDAAMAHAGLL